MANLSKIVECASQLAFDNISQKDENVLYLTPENTINIVAGNGIDVEKTVDENGNETYVIGLIPPTNFIEAFEQGFNFNGKTITFTNTNTANQGGVDYAFEIRFNNGYKISGYSDIGIGHFHTNIILPTQTTSGSFDASDLPYTYTFFNYSDSSGLDNATVSGFYILNDIDGVYNQVTPEEFAIKLDISFRVED